MATNPHFGTRSPPACCRRGSLLIAMLLVSTLGILGAPFVTISLNESRLQVLTTARAAALAVAEAGVERALWEFNYHNATFARSNDCTAANVPDACCTAANTGPTCWVTVTGASCPTGTCRQRDYSVTSGSGTTLGTATVLAKNITATTLIAVESTGQGTGSGIPTKVVVNLQRATLSPFQEAAFSLVSTGNGIRLEGPITLDSYDSRAGSYGGFNIGSNADVRTNSTGTGVGTEAIRVTDGATVKGSAYRGTGGQIFTATGGTIMGTQDVKPQKTLPAAPDPTEPAGCIELGGYSPGNVVLTGTVYCADYIFMSGNFTLDFPNLQQLYIRNDLTLDGAKLRVGQGTVTARTTTVKDSGTFEGYTGRVDLFTSGLLVQNDSILTGTSNLPKNLRIYRADLHMNSGNFMINGSNARVYGALYVVGTGYAVHIDDQGSFYGAVIGETVWFSTGGGTPGYLHFDEAMKEVNDGWPSWLTGGKSPTAVTITSWQRDPTN